MRGVALALFCMCAWSSDEISIVTPANPPAPVRFAAGELAKYLGAMGNSGVHIRSLPQPGDIYLGVLPQGLAATERELIEGRLHGKDPDSFVIRSGGGKLVILGGSARANLYGAYHYLESLGACWHFPGAENEVVPRARARLDGYDVLEVPSFRKRGLVIFSNTLGFPEIVDFAAKRKLNTIGLHVFPYPPPPALIDLGYETAEKAARPRGLDIDIERHLFGESFCPDDARTLEAEREILVKYVATMPPAMNDFFLWAADKFLPACQSPKYRQYTVSDSVLWFSNRMAETLRSIRPRARFPFLAYHSTEEAPRHERPGPGVFLEWAPISQSFAAGIDDTASRTNASYRAKFEAQLKVFQASEAQVLGYWVNDGPFNRAKYGRLPHAPEAMKADLAYYRRMGVRDVTSFGPMRGREYYSTRASPALFLYPDLLWNVQADPRALVRAFCRDYFGSGEIARVFDLLTEADRMVYVDNRKVLGKSGDPEFVAKVTEAMEIAYRYLNSQKQPQGRARAAKLIQEISVRFSGTG
jgi:hypothetical protein